MITMNLENMLTNIYRNNAYADKIYLLTIQAAAVVAGKCFRVKFAAL